MTRMAPVEQPSTRTVEPAFIGRTYDDFLFRPQAGRISTRREVSLRSRLTAALALELPIVSANMDSVTGPRMAQTMALEGGLGIVQLNSAFDPTSVLTNTSTGLLLSSVTMSVPLNMATTSAIARRANQM